jgi:predicted nucleotidyltransferase
MEEDIFEGREVTEDVTLRVLAEAETALEKEGIPHMLMGGLASSAHGRPRWTHDVDVLVRPTDAGRALRALAEAGFETQETDPFWIYKGVKEGVLVDVIFRSSGDIFLDEEMLAHARPVEVSGVRVCMVAPEDLIVIKAVVHAEQSPRHWFDAIAMLSRTGLDWDYLLLRARKGARRVLSLLLYAQSNDVLVPDAVVRRLFEMVMESEETVREAG